MSFICSARKLNELLNTAQRRTRLDAGENGVRPRPPGPPVRLREGQACVVGRRFMRRLHSKLTGALPVTLSEGSPEGHVPGPSACAPRGPRSLESSVGGWTAAKIALRRARPQEWREQSPMGWWAQPHLPRIASLKVELQTFEGRAQVCYLDLKPVHEEGYITKRTTTLTAEHGSYYYSAEASGVIQGYAIGDEPDACEAIVYDDTFDPELDYGETQSEEVVEEEQDWHSARSAAIAAAEEVGVFESGWSWGQDTWAEASLDASAPLYIATARSALNLDLNAWQHTTFKWRAVNIGRAAIKLDYGYPLSTETPPYDTSDSVTLAPGQTSEWFNPPTPGLAEELAAYLTRVRLGPYLRAP